MRPQQTLTAMDVQEMLDSGSRRSEVVARLVETGIWSDAGAQEIVRFLTEGPDELLARNHTFRDRKPAAQSTQ